MAASAHPYSEEDLGKQLFLLVFLIGKASRNNPPLHLSSTTELRDLQAGRGVTQEGE